MIFGLTIRTLGEIMVGLAVISVHMRIMKEHKLDRKVYRSIRNEKFWAIIGIIFIISGFLIEVASSVAGGIV